MTPERRQELRDWSAKLNQFIIKPYDNNLSSPCYYTKEGKFVCFVGNWTPDLDSAPASQILGVIDKIKELVWYLFWDNENNNDFGTAEFIHKTSGEKHFVNAKVFGEAVLEAAWATGEGR